jgi:D-amino-acid dehydrogenase
MSGFERTEVAVIGAGVVGVSCALWLRRQGHEVQLLEREAIATGASYGNASTLADYGCTPIARPEIWGNLPRLLFSADSPFVVNWARLPRLLPWLLRFLGQCNSRRFQANAEVLAQLLRGTYDDYAPLLDDEPAAAALIQRRGCLYAYGQAGNLRAARGDIELRERFGIAQQVLDADEVAALEPAMAGHTVGGILFPGSSHLEDPQAFIEALAAPLLSEGRLRQAEVVALQRRPDGLQLRCADGRELLAERVVLAGGAWSAALARQVGDRIPLDTERGYHVEFDLQRPLLTRPTCPVESAFYMTPLRGRLRAAGTVELGSLHDPANPRRLRYIEERVRQVLGLKDEVARTWLGFRPSLPDSLPVLGPSPREPRLIYAFGHQHLGLTLGGVTGRLVADCLAGRQPDWLAACSASRF